ncbi:MAG: hypothetical protein ACR2IS_19940 [Nitrososphaeraceae archaeon]
MKSTRLNQKVNKDHNDSPVLAQIPETSSSTTTPGLSTIQVQQLKYLTIKNNDNGFFFLPLLVVGLLEFP